MPIIVVLAATLAVVCSESVCLAASWVFTGSLNVGRYGHTATLLRNRKVLVTGGFDADGHALDSAELYNPKTGIWESTGSMAAARADHTATLLSNGKVLVVGGNPGPGGVGFLSTAELYDPATETWTSTGSLNYARYYHTATLLAGGRVLVTGGAGDWPNRYLSITEIYSPANGTWTTTGSLNERRLQHSATLLKNGQVLVAGGWTNDGGYHIINSAELYNPATEIWTSTGSLAEARVNHSATRLPDGRVLVAGGQGLSGSQDTAELYNPTAGTWASTGSLNAAYSDNTGTLLKNGQILVVGQGWNYPCNAELYSSNPGTWTATGPPVNVGRSDHTATLLANGQVLTAGGTDVSGGILSSAELYGSPHFFLPTALNILLQD